MSRVNPFPKMGATALPKMRATALPKMRATELRDHLSSSETIVQTSSSTTPSTYRACFRKCASRRGVPTLISRKNGLGGAALNEATHIF